MSRLLALLNHRFRPLEHLAGIRFLIVDVREQVEDSLAKVN